MTTRGTSGDDAQFAELLKFLADPNSYPNHPASVKVIQTHASVAVLAGEFVYKVRKPVNFGFLDFSTLEKRHHFAQREIELNSRLSPHLYLEVVPIVERDQRLTFDESASPADACEFAVKMHRMDERYFLINLLASHELDTNDIDRIMEALVPFYLSQVSSPEIARNGTPDNVLRTTAGNLRFGDSFVGESVSAPAMDALVRFNRRFVTLRRALLQRRVRDGFIKNCHGDLHAEHIHLAPDRVSIYDCIEFNDQFRYIDVAADVAFLAMDLRYAGRRDLEVYFVLEMARRLKDPRLLDLVRFYECYRAAVRGKVHGLRSQEPELEVAQRKESRATCVRYYQLALRLALFDDQPIVIVVMGGVGTGKSTVARAVAADMGVPVFSSDRIRKELHGLPLEQRPPDGVRARLYTTEASQKTYAELISRADKQLERGGSVVLDATFGRRRYRDELLRHLQAREARCLFVELQASRDTVRARLKQRVQSGDVSDARADDLTMLEQRYEPPSELSSTVLIRASSAGGLDRSLRQVYRSFVRVTVC